MMHWTGNGVPRNPVHAYVWFDLAARSAKGIAEEYRDRVAKDYLSPREIETARALADVWGQARDCPLRSSGT
jgi:TPR repeat protein